MDVIAFEDGAHPWQLEYGRIVNGLKSIQWTERYREPDDFKITAPLSARLDEYLPIGTCLTTVDSDSVMLVENIEIVDQADSPSEVHVSGRSIETIFERRDWHITVANTAWQIIGWPKINYPNVEENMWGLGGYGTPQFRASNVQAPFYLAHFLNGNLTREAHIPFLNPGFNTDSTDDFFALPAHWIRVDDRDFGDVNASPYPGLRYHEEVSLGDVSFHESLLNVLAIDNFGCRVLRPGRNGNPWTDKTLIQFHPGQDLRNDVILSSETGDITSATILHSEKDYYNAIMLITTHQAYMLRDDALQGADRKFLKATYTEVDADYDFDYGTQTWSDPDNPGDSSGTVARKVFMGCRTKARELLMKHSQTSKTSVEVKRNLDSYRFRSDFNVGDIIVVDHGLTAPIPQRVSEYVEIEDENGYFGYPVLETPNSELYGITEVY